MKLRASRANQLIDSGGPHSPGRTLRNAERPRAGRAVAERALVQAARVEEHFDDKSALAIDLETFRHVGDPLADAAVSEYFATVAKQDPGALFGALVRHTKLPAEQQVPAVQRFFSTAAAVPEWVDRGAVARGQEFFNRLVAHHFAALYLGSLPNSYAAAKGVQVLRMTGRLATDTQRRLDETAQLLMDLSAPGALDPGAEGVQRVLHVRLMHAAVRWMILHDPNVIRVAVAPPPQVESESLTWSFSWGVPINQEDLAGTWLTFTEVVYEAFAVMGVDVDEQEIADHLHLWRLAAHFLGIDPRLVPLNRSEAVVLKRRIFGRQQEPCAAGRVMTAALLNQARGRVPRIVWPLMVSSFRMVLGDRVCDTISIPPNNWTRVLFTVMSAVSRLTTRDPGRFHQRWSAWCGRHLMDGLLSEMRHGERPTFSIPTHLAGNR